MCDVDLEAAAAARLRDPSHRPAARASERRALVLPAGRGAARRAAPGRRAPAPHRRADRAAAGGDLRGAVARAARLRDEERLRPRRPRHLRRHRLRARRLPRGGRARRGARERRGDALALLLRRDAAGRARARARTSGSRRSSSPIAPVMEAYEQALREQFRGHRARHHRGEPAGAHPRQPADGAVEQVRLARADDRQQVGDVGRLHDPLRRPRGRLRGDQGRAQDARLRAVRVAQLARGSAPAGRERRHRARSSRSRARSSSARPRPSCATTSATSTRFPPTRCSTASCTATSSSTAAASS